MPRKSKSSLSVNKGNLESIEDAMQKAKNIDDEYEFEMSKGHVPCVYLPYALGSSKVILYFHGNAEDIGLATELLDYLRTLMRVRNFNYI